MLFPVKVDGKYGYISLQGELVVQPRFVFCASFVDGVGLLIADTQYSFVDVTGEVIGSIETEWCDSAHEGFAAFSREAVGFGKQGYVAVSGTVAISPQFDDAAAFSEGLASVLVGHSTGVIDKSGSWVIDKNRFEKIGAFASGLASARLDGRWGYIDREGKTIVEFSFDRAWSVSEKRLLVSEGRRLGYLDMSGSVRIPCQFEAAEPFSGGVAACAIHKGQSGFIDGDGNWIIPPRFTAAKSFSGGLAAVYLDGAINEDGDPVGGKWGYCNLAGEMVIEAQFERVDSFVGGLARVLSGELLSKDEMIGYVDLNGAWVWKPTR